VILLEGGVDIVAEIVHFAVVQFRLWALAVVSGEKMLLESSRHSGLMGKEKGNII
jgi:hypothetical protein